MTYSASSQSSSSSWGDDLLRSLFPSVAEPPHPNQDSDLLQQFGFMPGLKEAIMLRQVHALEHATVWTLDTQADLPLAASSQPTRLVGGMSTDRGFYLYGQVDINLLEQAARTALRRITHGNWDLAVHPQCGTNLSVNLLLTAGMALGASMLLLPRGPIEQILGIGVATVTAASIAPDLGSLAQRYVTTSIPFNLSITDVSRVPDYLGHPAHYIQVRWVE